MTSRRAVSAGMTALRFGGHSVAAQALGMFSSILDASARADEARASADPISLLAFTEQAWPILEPKQPFVNNWHLGCFAEHLTAVHLGQIQNILFNVPFGTSKSLQASVMFPAWEWTRRPSESYLCGSYDQQLSIRDNRRMRDVIRSPWYQTRWPLRLREDQDTKTRFDNDQRGWRIGTSVGGLGTGEHPTRKIIDDPHNVKKSLSDVQRKEAILWFDLTMSGRGAALNAATIIIMQRLHEQDLSGHILETMRDRFTVVILPMRYEAPKRVEIHRPATPSKPAYTDVVLEPRMPVTPLGWQDPRTTPGELLWPALFDEAKVRDLETILGGFGTAGQLQQRPAPQEGAMLKRGWFRFYRELPSDVTDWLQSRDMTFKEATDNDFVCGGVWCRRGSEKYLVHRIKERLDFPTTLMAVRSLTAAYPKATLKLFENKANGPAVISTLGREIAGIVPVEPKTSKEGRVAGCSPTIEAGNVFLPDPSIAPWVEDFLAEVTTFPRAQHDDQVDMMTQALLRYLDAAQVRVW